MRVKASYTIDKKILHEFNLTAQFKAMNKSALIEKLMYEWMTKIEEYENGQFKR